MSEFVDRWVEIEEMHEILDLPPDFDGAIESVEVSFSPSMRMWHLVTYIDPEDA